MVCLEEKNGKMDIAEVINKYGFPIVAAGGMGYLIYYVWEWATKEIKPTLGEANTVLIALIDRIRMLDNDLIRLNQKVSIVLMMREIRDEKKQQKIDKSDNSGYRHDDSDSTI